jgi:hypothetical protein
MGSIGVEASEPSGSHGTHRRSGPCSSLRFLIQHPVPRISIPAIPWNTGSFPCRNLRLRSDQLSLNSDESGDDRHGCDLRKLRGCIGYPHARCAHSKVPPGRCLSLLSGQCGARPGCSGQAPPWFPKLPSVATSIIRAHSAQVRSDGCGDLCLSACLGLSQGCQPLVLTRGSSRLTRH